MGTTELAKRTIRLGGEINWHYLWVGMYWIISGDREGGHCIECGHVGRHLVLYIAPLPMLLFSIDIEL